MFEQMAFRGADELTFLLPESLRIDQSGTHLSWVDIERGTLSRCHLASGEVSTQFVATDLSFAHPLGNGDFLISAGPKLGVLSHTGELVTSPPLISSNRRFNDGFVDPRGRVIVGAKNLGAADGHNPLFIVEEGGLCRVLDEDLGLSNGLASHPQTQDLVTVDSAESALYMRKLEPGGAYSDRSLFYRFVDGATPDGICFDRDGNLYVALWGDGSVARIDATGKEVDRFAVPSPFVTSVALHPTTGELFVATASEMREGFASGDACGRMWRAPLHTNGLPVSEWIPVNLEKVARTDADN